MLKKLVMDYLTGLDGETFAIGRALGMALFVGGTPLPVLIGVWNALTAHPTLSDWGNFLAPAAAYYGAIAASVTGLIQLTNGSEPKAPVPPPVADPQGRLL